MASIANCKRLSEGISPYHHQIIIVYHHSSPFILYIYIHIYIYIYIHIYIYILYGHGSKPWYPSEHQNRWDLWMWITTQIWYHRTIGFDPWPIETNVTSEIHGFCPPEFASRSATQSGEIEWLISGGEVCGLHIQSVVPQFVNAKLVNIAIQ